MTGQADRPLSTRDVAVLFGVDAKTVARWAAAGRLPHFTTPGGHKRFLRRDLEPMLTPQGGLHDDADR